MVELFRVSSHLGSTISFEEFRVCIAGVDIQMNISFRERIHISMRRMQTANLTR